MVRALRDGHLTGEHLHERLVLLHRRQEPPPPAASATLQGLRGISHLTLLSQRHAPTPMLRNQRPKTGHDPRLTTLRPHRRPLLRPHQRAQKHHNRHNEPGGPTSRAPAPTTSPKHTPTAPKPTIKHPTSTQHTAQRPHKQPNHPPNHSHEQSGVNWRWSQTPGIETRSRVGSMPELLARVFSAMAGAAGSSSAKSRRCHPTAQVLLVLNQ